MANIQNGNSFYIDTVHVTDGDDLTRKNVLVAYVTVTATAANGRVVLGDAGTDPQTKLDLRVVTSEVTEHFRYDSAPIIFPNGIRVMTLTSAVATVVFKNAGG